MVSLVLAILIVNLAQKLIMKITGTYIMFYSLKSKILWYAGVWALLFEIIGI